MIFYPFWTGRIQREPSGENNGWLEALSPFRVLDVRGGMQDDKSDRRYSCFSLTAGRAFQPRPTLALEGSLDISTDRQWLHDQWESAKPQEPQCPALRDSGRRIGDQLRKEALSFSALAAHAHKMALKWLFLVLCEKCPIFLRSTPHFVVSGHQCWPQLASLERTVQGPPFLDRHRAISGPAWGPD